MAGPAMTAAPRRVSKFERVGKYRRIASPDLCRTRPVMKYSSTVPRKLAGSGPICIRIKGLLRHYLPSLAILGLDPKTCTHPAQREKARGDRLVRTNHAEL